MGKTVCLAMASVLAVVVLGSVGCGGADYGDLGRVSGTVTMDGTPLPGAQVVFSPANGRPSMGITDAQGKYQLIYIRDTLGAALGEHRVEITTVQESVSDTDAGPVKEPIPAKYNAKTTLTAKVEPGDNEIDFALEAK